MLPLTRQSVPHLSRRVAAVLALVVVGAVALPTVYLSVTPRARADEKPATVPAKAETQPTKVEAPAKPSSTPSTAPQTSAAPVAGTTYLAPPTAVPTPSPAPQISSAPVDIYAQQPKDRPPAQEFLPPLTANERRIVAALNEPTKFEFADTALSDVFDYIKQKHEIEVQLDLKGLGDAAVDPSAPVTRSVDGISLRSALRLILAQLDLTYIIDDEVLLITSNEKADETILTRTYPVEDLLTVRTHPPGEGKQSAKYEAPRDPAQPKDDAYEPLVKTIMRTIKPDSWAESGGSGDIAAVAASKSLVISQSYDVHEKVLNLLRSLRAARDPDSAAAAQRAPTEKRSKIAQPQAAKAPGEDPFAP